MGKANNNGRQLSDDLDKVISGEQSEVTDESLEDLDKTLKFAKRMVDSRIDPSPAFRDNLRKRLLSKMIEQEMETERKKAGLRSFWDNIIAGLTPRSPAWRTVIASIAVFMVALVVVWRMGLFTDTSPIVGLPPTTGVGSQSPIEVTTTISKETYNTGELISVKFTFHNESEEVLTLETFPPKLVIAAASLRPYKTIPGGESKKLSPSETIEYTFTWDQIDDNEQQVPPGTYVINMLDIELEDGRGTVTLPESPHIVIEAP